MFLGEIPRRFDFSEGLATCPFHSRPLCLYFLWPAVICCDKAASTGDARVSRVEGHASVVGPYRGRSKRAKEVMIYL